MESTVRAPQIGDDVIVLLKMEGGRFTELGGYIEEISAQHAYFALDSVHLITAKDFDSPLESKKWPKTATKLLRVGVPLYELKPFDGTFDEDAPCWEVRM